MAEIKHTARKEHLQRLFDTERYAPWALNCGQWPDNLLTTDEKNGFVNLHKLHAKERMGMLITILEEKRLQDQAQYEAFIATFETMCRNKEINEDIAMKILSRLSSNE